VRSQGDFTDCRVAELPLDFRSLSHYLICVSGWESSSRTQPVVVSHHYGLDIGLMP
jgi:hypothetical protein